MREIPRRDYAAVPERHDVRVQTRDGLVYEFDVAHFSADTLMGLRRRDVEGPGDEFARLAIPLEEVDQLSSRGIDWKRTSLIGGVVLAAVIVGGLSASHNINSDESSSGGKIPPAVPGR